MKEKRVRKARERRSWIECNEVIHDSPDACDWCGVMFKLGQENLVIEFWSRSPGDDFDTLQLALHPHCACEFQEGIEAALP